MSDTSPSNLAKPSFRGRGGRQQQGILGPRPHTPQQAYYMGAPYPMHGNQMTPTELDAAFNTMRLNMPDNSWYMDTGSTSHVASTTEMGAHSDQIIPNFM